MNIKMKIAAIFFALTLAPAYVAAAEKGEKGAADKEFNGTVVSKEEKSIKVKTKEGEKTLAVGTKTKGLENAKEGEKVTIKYTEKDGQLRASEINPR
jgi:PDZ domain-containing secreted protein